MGSRRHRDGYPAELGRGDGSGELDLDGAGAGLRRAVLAAQAARALDDPQLGAAQVSSISAQLLRTLEPIQKAAPPQADRLDDLAAKAKARREAAAAS